MWFRAKCPCVYILASRRNGTLYIGVTSDLANRVSLHKQNLIEGFTKKYRVHLLVYCETHPTMEMRIRPSRADGRRLEGGSRMARDPGGPLRPLPAERQ
jgi:predicted GIY-YIG superfamily endonuclease